MKIPLKPRTVKKILEKYPNVFRLVEKKEIVQTIMKYNQRYIHWDQFRFKKLPRDIKHEEVWALMKIFRKNGYRFLKFDGWDFNYSLTDDSLRKLHLLDKGSAGRLGAELESFNPDGRDQFIISSLMEEAIASSQLEGAATTRKIAKSILRLNKKPRNYSEKMIVNGYRTMQKIVKLKEKKITPDMILKLHKEITQDTLESKKDEGRFRNNNEIVVADPLDPNKVYHVPPNHKKVPKLIKEFCDFANDNTEFIHPIIKGIVLHFLIGYIHPFNDGNGRSARSLFYWYVLTRGYWLFEYMAISRILLKSKTKYGLAYLYTETDENDLTYFINYNLNAIEEALHEMEKYISRKQKEQIEAMKLIKGLKGINLRQADVLKELIKGPEKTVVINEVMNTYGVAYDTARNDLLHLAELGYLEKIKIQKRFVFKLAKKEDLTI